MKNNNTDWLEYYSKLSEYIDNELAKIKKFWLRNKNYQNTWIKINTLGNSELWESKPIGETYKAKPGEKVYAESEIDGRLKAVKAQWMKNCDRTDDWYIALTPLTSGYDYIICCNGEEYFFEAKDRNFTTTSTLAKDGVMIEQTKVEEAFRDGYINQFYYINSFSDRNIFIWHLNSLPNNTWVPHTVPCNNSTVDFRYKKEKVVYFLPLELRMANMDLKIF